MVKRGEKKAAIELSFGMIFSIILIVAFLSVGVYAIIKLLDFQKTAQIGIFLDDLRNNVETVWKNNNQVNWSKSYSLPTTINSVCFRNDEFENLEFVSNKAIDGEMIEHIDIAKTTEDENPFCIQNVNGKVNLRLVKELGEVLVTIKR